MQFHQLVPTQYPPTHSNFPITHVKNVHRQEHVIDVFFWSARGYIALNQFTFYIYICQSTFLFKVQTELRAESWENSSCGLCNWLECLYCPIAYCRIRWQFYAVGWISSWNVGNVHPIKIIQERKRGGEESQIVSRSGIECSHYAALQSNQECKDGLARKV